MLTLSVSATHRQLRTRQAVDPAEARAWVGAIVGPNWLPHVYAAGNLSGFAGPGASPSKAKATAHFYLFLGPDGVPHAEPEHQLRVKMVPLVNAA